MLQRIQFVLALIKKVDGKVAEEIKQGGSRQKVYDALYPWALKEGIHPTFLMQRLRQAIPLATRSKYRWMLALLGLFVCFETIAFVVYYLFFVIVKQDYFSMLGAMAFLLLGLYNLRSILQFKTNAHQSGWIGIVIGILFLLWEFFEPSLSGNYHQYWVWALFIMLFTSVLTLIFGTILSPKPVARTDRNNQVIGWQFQDKPNKDLHHL